MKKLLIFILMIYGCSPKMIVNQPTGSKTYPETNAYESFATIEMSDLERPSNQELIANVEMKETGLTVNCGYETIKRLAEETARSLGGNCLMITEHKVPDNNSTCDRIKASVLKIDNPEQYEKKILWHPKRPLKIANFKGVVDGESSQVGTITSINYVAIPDPMNGKAKVIVEALFDCNKSYFKTSWSDSTTLSLRQTHFDIAEIYARKFRKVIIEEMPNFNVFLAKHENAFSKISGEFTSKIDQYDSEIHRDISLHAKWKDWVKSELSKLDNYKGTMIEMNLR